MRTARASDLVGRTIVEVCQRRARSNHGTHETALYWVRLDNGLKVVFTAVATEDLSIVTAQIVA